MRRIRLLGLLVALAVLLPLGLVTAPAQATTTTTTTTTGLPGGRATYVMAMIGGPTNQMYVNLATYQFATNGTLTEKVWSWRQNNIIGTVAYTKPYSGYTTNGCLRVCPVRTPVGFQKGGAPITATGTWHIDVYGHVYIGWSWGAAEIWRLDASQAGFVSASIWTSNRAILKGWGFGSNASPTAGATVGQIYSTDRLYGPLVQNAYASATQFVHAGFHFPEFTRCTNGTCLEGNGNTAADKKTWFHTYIAGSPAADGRKNYWNFQTGAVAQLENPGTICISASGGGHTAAMLQVIDDGGRFRGWVGVEASLAQAYYGRAIVGAFASVLPGMLTTLH